LTVGCGGSHGLGHDAAAPAPDATLEAGAEAPANMGADTGDAPPPETDARADAEADAGVDAEDPVPGCDAGTDGGAWQLLGGPLSTTGVIRVARSVR
jgi:hypothetical protein